MALLVQAALLLREALTSLPTLASALAPAQSELLKAVHVLVHAFSTLSFSDCDLCRQKSHMQKMEVI